MVQDILLDAISRVQTYLSTIEGAGRIMDAQEIHADIVARISPQLLTKARAYLADCKANGTLDTALTADLDTHKEIPADIGGVINMMYEP